MNFAFMTIKLSKTSKISKNFVLQMKILKIMKMTL